MKYLPIVLAAVLLGAPAWAAEGDQVSSYSSGEWVVAEFLLCDGDYVDGTPPNTCATFDLHRGTVTTSAGGTINIGGWQGLPQYLIAEVRLDNGGAPNNNIGFLEGRSSAAGVRHQLHATGLELATAVSHTTIDPITHRFLSYEVTTEGVGTDMEVVVRLFYRRHP